jgi:hypothetical protein
MKTLFTAEAISKGGLSTTPTPERFRQSHRLDQYRPAWIRTLSAMDDLLHSIRAPQIIDASILFLFILSGYLIYVSAW